MSTWFLMMSVFPGFAGQAFIAEVLAKITEVGSSSTSVNRACSSKSMAALRPITSTLWSSAGGKSSSPALESSNHRVYAATIRRCAKPGKRKPDYTVRRLPMPDFKSQIQTNCPKGFWIRNCHPRSARRVVFSFRVLVCRVGAWLSLVERTVRVREAGGSNPLAPTNPSLEATQFFDQNMFGDSSREPSSRNQPHSLLLCWRR